MFIYFKLQAITSALGSWFHLVQFSFSVPNVAIPGRFDKPRAGPPHEKLECERDGNTETPSPPPKKKNNI